MAPKEELENEIKILENKKNDLLSKVQDLSSRLVHSEKDLERLNDAKEVLENDHKKSILEHNDKVAQLYSDVHSRDGQVANKSNEIDALLASIKEREKSIASEEISLEERKNKLRREESEFLIESNAQKEKLLAAIKSHDTEVSEKLRVLSIENDQREVLIRVQNEKIESLSEKEKSFQEILDAANNRHQQNCAKELELAASFEDLKKSKKENEELKILLDSKKVSLDSMNKEIDSREKILKEKEIWVELKTREINALDKKVQQAIKVNNLEKDVL